ncbi:MAG: class I SAM-dependent methyltransferase [Alphaproteobacteria bacterium]|nr:class I SAM-dependent methyltransferase [Alphaproteobacteria bacterium]
MSADLQKQYEAYPYPYRDPRSAPIITFMNDLALIGHYGFSAQTWYRQKDCRVLVAGGGTGDATLHLAMQLSSANPEAQIIHLDLSEVSNNITQQRLEYQGYKNVKVVQDSLLDLPKGEHGTFDYINCSGVLHHLKEPNEGAKALCSVLKDNGVMSVMLYGELGRRIVYDIQNLASMVTEETEALDQCIPIVNEILAAVPEQNPLRNVFPLNMPDAELVDRYLHPQDRAYTVSQIFEMLEASSLKLLSFLPKAQYDPLLMIPEGPLQDRVRDLPEEQRMAFAEILSGTMARHMFFATKKENKKPQMPDPKNLSLIPVLIGPGRRLRQQEFPGGVAFAQPIMERLEPEHLKIASLIDDQTSLEDIYKACSNRHNMSAEDFNELWLEIYRVLGSRGNVVLKEG